MRLLSEAAFLVKEFDVGIHGPSWGKNAMKCSFDRSDLSDGNPELLLKKDFVLPQFISSPRNRQGFCFWIRIASIEESRDGDVWRSPLGRIFAFGPNVFLEAYERVTINND
jgi:hypothetical protein